MRKLSDRKNKKGHRYYRIVVDDRQYEISLIKLLALFKFGLCKILTLKNSLRVKYSSIGHGRNDLWIYSKESDVRKIRYENVEIGDVYRALYYKYKDSLELFYTNAVSLLNYSLKSYKEAVNDGYRVYRDCSLGNRGFIYRGLNPSLIINNEGCILNLETCRLIKPVKNRSKKSHRNKDIAICGLNLRLNVLVYQTFYEDIIEDDERVLSIKKVFDGSDLYKSKGVK